MDILQAIGNTSMVRLRKVVPSNGADILVKLEWENPTGSLKDRMAEAVISRAEADGRLKPGDTGGGPHALDHFRGPRLCVLTAAPIDLIVHGDVRGAGGGAPSESGAPGGGALNEARP